MDNIATRIQGVKAEIAAALLEAGRSQDDAKLIAVSKLNPISAVREAVAAGQVDFGENHVQELVAKHAELPNLNWHMIGSLQRNKVKYIASFVHLIHSVDSERLLREISDQAAKHGRIVPCLLQINISDEPQKGGFEESEAASVLARMAEFPYARIDGLMGMAAFTNDQAVIRAQFRRLATAARQFRALEGAQVSMRELSMGMSGDFQIAIAEGATLVRVGSNIFGHRNTH